MNASNLLPPGDCHKASDGNDFASSWGVASGTSSFTAQNLQYSLVSLRSWPDLTRLPEEQVQDVARICALLCYRPSAGTLVPQLSGLEREHVYHLLDALYLGGHIDCGQHVPQQAESPARSTGSPEERGVPLVPAAQSFIAKLWRRLGVGN